MVRTREPKAAIGCPRSPYCEQLAILGARVATTCRDCPAESQEGAREIHPSSSGRLKDLGILLAAKRERPIRELAELVSGEA